MPCRLFLNGRQVPKVENSENFNMVTSQFGQGAVTVQVQKYENHPRGEPSVELTEEPSSDPPGDPLELCVPG